MIIQILKIKISLVFMCVFIYLCFYNNSSIESIKIIIFSNNSDKNNKYFVGENYKFNIKISPNTTNETVFLKSSNKNLIEFFNDHILMKSTGRECLTASTKKMSSTICFNIYNSQELSFKEAQSLKIETNSVMKLSLDKNYYNKLNIKYISDHPQIVKVDSEGMITAIRPGNARIMISCSGYKIIQINVTATVKNGLINNNTLNIYNASEYENIMIVAHPDDETLWGGVNLLKDSYFVVCLTNGYNSIRAKEFKELLKFTKNGGIILNYPDVQDKIRDDWSEVKIGILKDLTTIINYKYWKKIVTYGYDGTYGHIQHQGGFSQKSKYHFYRLPVQGR